MKRLITIALLLISLAGSAQVGNEWIIPGVPYYKIKTAADGIYRITYADLQNAGFDFSQNAQKLQLYHRGQEVAIYVEGQQDGTLDPGDYIEFYGQRNDGTLDQQLYQSPGLQPHNYYSLFTDTTAYFLTVNPGLAAGLRMEEVQPIENLGGLPPEEWYWEEHLQVLTTAWSYGFTENQYVALTAFDTAEGWTGSRILEGAFDDYTVNSITGTVTSGPDPELEILLVGRFEDTSRLEVRAGPDALSLRVLGNYEIIGQNELVVSTPLNWSDISPSGDLVVRFTNTDVGGNGNTSLFSPSYLKLRYPAAPDLQSGEEREVYLRTEPAGESFVEFSNVPDGTALYDLTNPGAIRRLGYERAGTTISTVVENTNQERTLLFYGAPASVSLERVVFNTVTVPDFAIVTHPLLRRGTDPVQQYASWKQSEGYSTGIFDIQRLYDQFSYGETSPLALFNFSRYLYQNGPPEFIFLIGKGLELTYKYWRNGPSNGYHDLVPSAGMPASDIAFTAGLQGTPHLAAIPIGRLPADRPEQVQQYLEKAQVREVLADMWTKDILHLSGGKTAGEQVLFRTFMDGFKGVAEDIYLGGSVETRQRTTTGTSERIDIRDLVNDGLGLITMFGHSNPFVVDIDIGYASDPSEGYAPQGRYPFLFVNGCEAGRVFLDTLQWGPDWVMADEKGSVGMIAHTYFGFSGALRYYTNLFYRVGFGDSVYVNRSVGEIQQEVARRYLENVAPTPLTITQVQQMLLNGDPSLPLFPRQKPDYRTEDDWLTIDAFDARLNSEADSLRLSLVVENPGIAIADTALDYRITWTVGDTTLLVDRSASPTLYRDTLTFTLYSSALAIQGENSFTIAIDPDQKVDEEETINNVASLNVNIPFAGTVNLFPQNLSVISDDTVRMVVQSGSLVPEQRMVEIQIGTSREAYTPWVTTTLSTLLDTVYVLPDIDSTVYYWRTRYADPREGEDRTWSASSFTYIRDAAPGFSQAHIGQFRENRTEEYVYDTLLASYQFPQSESTLRIKTYGAANPDNDYTTVEVTIDDTPIVYPTRLCLNNSLGAIAFDKSSLKPYVAFEADIPLAITCGRTPQVVNALANNWIQNNDTLSAYMNRVKDGDYIAFFSIGSLNYPAWPATEREQFLRIGIDPQLLDTLAAGEPLIFFGRKDGNGSETQFVIRNDTLTTPVVEHAINFDHSFSGQAETGRMFSVKVGPATNWSRMAWSIETNSPADDGQLEYVEEAQNGGISTLFAGFSPGDTTFSARNAPYIYVNKTFSDTAALSAPQPDYWITEADPLPEGILRFVTNEDGGTLQNQRQEGQTFESLFVFENISEMDFSDSLLVEKRIGNRTYLPTVLRPLPAGASDTIRFEIDTEGLVGQHDLEVRVNRVNARPEMNYENNVLVLEDYLRVVPDEINPVLDVSFDGRYILDGEIVSPRPFILVTLKDENEFLRKEDTTGIELLLDNERISLSSGNVTWVPATEEDDFRIEFLPDRLEDGVHTLSVNVTDATGNEAGEEPYAISFEVINESTITHFYPYPNPFSTSTRFVFTLTGSLIPDEIKIQVLTVTGKVVREINQDEIGPLRIGNNITEFAWDGTDEYGDQLANGVYLYRVVARIAGNEIKHRETSADRGFTNGVGKLYILR